MDFDITQKDYEQYLVKKDTISNERIRADNETFFDALLTVDMKNDPCGKRCIEALKAL